MIKGLLFDLDGVITDTAKYHFLAWKALADDLGITIDLAFNEELKGIDRMTSLEMILARGHQENSFSEEEKVALAVKKNAHYLELLEKLGPDDLLPGVLTFLKEAKQVELPCVVASASKNAPYILKQLGVSDYFAGIVDPESVSQGKPAPDIFLKAAEMLGISPEEAIGFEDAQAGVNALNAAGIVAVGISPADELDGTKLTIPDFRGLNMEELNELIG